MEDKVLELLDKYKQAKGLDDMRLARHLGVSGALLSYIRHGKRPVRAKLLLAIMMNCPEIRLDLAQIMSSKGGDAGR